MFKIRLKKILKKILMFFFKYRYFFMKLGISLLTLMAVVLLSFILIVNMPGTVVEAFALKLSSSRNISIEQATILAKQMLNYDPDAPILTRFWVYIQQIASGNLGVSVINDAKSVNDILEELLPNTMFISMMALLVSFLLGTFLGTKSALTRKKTIGEAALNGYIISSNAIPDYIFALVIILIFSFSLGWFPNQGAYSPLVEKGFNIPYILSKLYYGALPITALIFGQLGFWCMQMRGSAIGTLGEDYIQAARARGIPEHIISKKYVRKNAILPLITQFAISFGALFGGAPLMETIFNYPGIGQAFSQAIGQRDYYVVTGILLFTSVIIIVVNLVADLLYSIIDPRIRRSA